MIPPVKNCHPKGAENEKQRQYSPEQINEQVLREHSYHHIGLRIEYPQIIPKKYFVKTHKGRVKRRAIKRRRLQQ